VLHDLAAGRSIALDPEGIVSPTYVPDLVHAALDLLLDGEQGLWHLANQGMMSWCALAERVAAEAGLGWHVKPDGARHPERNTALSSERGLILPTLESAVSRYFEDCEVAWREEMILQAAE